MTTDEQISRLTRRLELERGTLAHYLEQRTIAGAANVRPEVTAGIRQSRTEIAHLKTTLCALGTVVADDPDDTEEDRLPQGHPGGGRLPLVHWLQWVEPGLAHSQYERLAGHILACPSARTLVWEGFAHLELLYDALLRLDGPAPPLETLRSVLDALHTGDMPYDRVVLLRALLMPLRLPADAVALAYAHARPRGPAWVMPATDLENPLPLIALLARAPKDQRRHTHPLVMFVHHLLELAGHEAALATVATDLRVWLNLTCAALAIPLPATAPAAANLRASVQVVIKEDSQSLGAEPRYYLEVYPQVQAPQVCSPGLIRPTTTSLTAAELRTVFVQAVSQGLQALRGYSADQPPLVEIFVPQELMLLAFDQWEIPQGRRSTIPVGMAHLCIIRFYDRIDPAYAADFMGNWRRKWGCYCGARESTDHAHLHWVDTADLVQRIDGDLRHPHIVGVIQTWLPDQQPEDQMLDITDRLLGSGMAVALIVRGAAQRNPSIARREIEVWLHGTDQPRTIGDLPAIIHDQRREASRDLQHIGAHLTLILDDPDHVPPIPSFA